MLTKYIYAEPRQVSGAAPTGPPSGLGSLLSGGRLNGLAKQKAYKIQEIKAVNPGAKRIQITYGPYKLRAANVGLKVLALDS
jgi:hypothetical protein